MIAETTGWLTSALQDPETRQKLIAQGLSPLVTCGADFGALIRKQYDEYGRIIRETEIKADLIRDFSSGSRAVLRDWARSGRPASINCHYILLSSDATGQFLPHAAQHCARVRDSSYQSPAAQRSRNCPKRVRE